MILYICDRKACSDKYDGVCNSKECHLTTKKEHAKSLLNGKDENELVFIEQGYDEVGNEQ